METLGIGALGRFGWQALWWGCLVPTLAFSVGYLTLGVAAVLEGPFGAGVPPNAFRATLLLGSALCLGLAVWLLRRTSAGAFVSFLLSMPVPTLGLAVELPPEETLAALLDSALADLTPPTLEVPGGNVEELVFEVSGRPPRRHSGYLGMDRVASAS